MSDLGGGQAAKGTVSPTAVDAKDVVVDMLLEDIKDV